VGDGTQSMGEVADASILGCCCCCCKVDDADGVVVVVGIESAAHASVG
jgi:hypothetical protein